MNCENVVSISLSSAVNLSMWVMGASGPPATHLAKGYVRFTVRERGEREN